MPTLAVFQPYQKKSKTPVRTKYFLGKNLYGYLWNITSNLITSFNIITSNSRAFILCLKIYLGGHYPVR